jgi:hypothetical protein
MLTQDYANLMHPPQAKYDRYQAAATRALTGWPAPDEETRAKDAKKDNHPFPDVVVPDAPRVASRMSPGVVPPKAG